MTNKIKLTLKEEKFLKKQNYTLKGINYLKKILDTDEEVCRSIKMRAGYVLLLSAVSFIASFILKSKEVPTDFILNIAFFCGLFLYPVCNYIILCSKIEFEDKKPAINKSNAVFLAGLSKKNSAKGFFVLSLIAMVMLSLVGMGHWFLAILFIAFLVLSYTPCIVQSNNFKELINAAAEK
jgi:hypothetical protein